MIKQTKSTRYKGFLPDFKIANFMEGRIMRRDDLLYPPNLIDTYIKKGLFIEHEAILVTRSLLKNHYSCNRCLNTEQAKFIHYQCAKCHQICTYCRHCIAMGRVASCSRLLTWNGPSSRRQIKHQLNWTSTLTELQIKESQELTDSIMRKRLHLLHAVCGSGKTEILFLPIYKALQQNLRVCIATPRIDVVLELAPRLRKVLPATTIHALYGGAPEQQGYSQLVIATTHQLYRFSNAFDVMIVDEADAFPYAVDAPLQKAVVKAKKLDAPIAFVTATPSSQLLKQRQGYSFIPKRYHNYPLPVPRFQPLWRYKQQFKKGKLPKQLQLWVEQCIANQQPFLIFFPTIEMLEQALPLFSQNILSVHAEDPMRKEKVLQLRHAEISGLLTTTILERGITIANLQVAVVGAESAIFTASALIQIAGRVGRSQQYPVGDIVFFHHGISLEMDGAKEEIERLNEVAYGQGSTKLFTM
ncbi:DEAD/DEAH box helicase family protein [Metasolibacillus meyeri]|uniref:DEAD/DEAH box helicase family protein n=1 Tax=Metasolibacillus meyeri TaxID=1071052 RepID=A0AAW9NN18_9BACL|nr:DEAD/DEAH box helicase [Metasolibacillus meyeri]MEC1178897.1 DEAD/DEAH box helicase family protein [Metasolibacillus meyeri]